MFPRIPQAVGPGADQVAEDRYCPGVLLDPDTQGLVFPEITLP